MNWDKWPTDPTYVIGDPPKGFERPPILDFVGQMTRDNGLLTVYVIQRDALFKLLFHVSQRVDLCDPRVTI